MCLINPVGSYRDGYQNNNRKAFVAMKRGVSAFIFLVGILIIVSSGGDSIVFAGPLTVQAEIDKAISDFGLVGDPTDISDPNKTVSNTPLATLKFDQSAFRIRTGDSAGLNGDSDWVGAPNENVSLWPDTPDAYY